MKMIVITSFLLDFVIQPPAIRIKNKIYGDGKPCVLEPENQIPTPLSRRQIIPEFGPKKDPKYYNPNYGYEPYWPGGEWVFSPGTTETGPSVTVTCHVDCPAMFIRYGTVCGRNLNYTHKTFENYCKLQEEDCTGRSKWLIAYRGKCLDKVKTYPIKQDLFVTHAEQYLLDFENRSQYIVKKKG